MYTNSIHFRMTLLYAFVLGFIIVVFSILVYNDFSGSLNRDLNSLIKSKADDIDQIIKSYNQEELIEGTGNTETVFSEEDLLHAAKYAVEENTSEELFLQVFGPDGKELVRSDNIKQQIKLVKDSRQKKNRTEGFFSDLKAASGDKDSLPLRIYNAHVSDRIKVPYYIQVSRSLIPVEKELNRLKTEVFLFLPLALLAMIGLGQFLTKMALSPVEDMRKAIHQITTKNLDKKIVLPDANDEIKRLAETFNDMLSGMNSAFSSQQRLVQDISHELRTPLTALKGNQEVTLSKKRRPEEYEAVLKLNLEEIDRVIQLVESLLLLARLDNKATPFKTAKVDLYGLLGQVLNNMRVLADKKNISTALLPGGDIFTEADEGQLNRVFTNIIHNAIKYTPEKGAVEIEVYRDGNLAKVNVTDTGIGISESDLAHIFERFFRADKSRSESAFGLGLSIAKSIVEAQKGTIEVASTPGKGTTFTVILPLFNA